MNYTSQQIKLPNKIRISPGNRKLGKIPSVSIDPIYSCAKDVPCKNSCYAIRMEVFRKNIMKSWHSNYQLYRDVPLLYFKQLQDWLLKNKPEYFRFHVGGDIPDVQYLRLLFDVVRICPDTKFLMFTKRFEWFGIMLSNIKTLNNFKIMLSAWEGENDRLGFLFEASMQYARMYTDDKINVAWLSTDPRLHLVGLSLQECKNDCSNCKYCWEGSGDVIFHKH